MMKNGSALTFYIVWYEKSELIIKLTNGVSITEILKQTNIILSFSSTNSTTLVRLTVDMTLNWMFIAVCHT